MNPDIKARWTTALRGEDFKQGQKKLAVKESPLTTMTHCCLGVLCELAVEDGIIEARNRSYGTGTIREFGKDTTWNEGQLPVEVADWAGFVSGPQGSKTDPVLFTVPDIFTEEDGHPEGHLYHVSCSEANDGYDYRQIPRKSFGEIADLIDERF